MKDWLKRYLAHMADERRVSGNTMQSYAGDLTDFANALEDGGVRFADELRLHHIQAYLGRLRADGKSVATIARRVVAIKGLCNYMAIHRGITYNPALQLEAPKAEKKTTRALGEADMDKLLSLPDVGSGPGLRDRAMLELIYATGLRASELVRLDVEHVRLDLRFLLCLGAGGKERIVPIGSHAAEWVAKYLADARPELEREGKPEPALFLNHHGSRLTRQGFWKLMKKYAERLGIELSPHTMRSSFASHMLDNGADIRAVQEMLGHVTPASTYVYQTATKPKMKEIYDRNHPRARTDSTFNR